eukprot:532502_1
MVSASTAGSQQQEVAIGNLQRQLQFQAVESQNRDSQVNQQEAILVQFRDELAKNNGVIQTQSSQLGELGRERESLLQTVSRLNNCVDSMKSNMLEKAATLASVQSELQSKQPFIIR